MTDDFCPGERYRLGFVLGKSGFDRDDWTGLVVQLVQPVEGGLWRCRRSATEMVVFSEERLRASARVLDEPRVYVDALLDHGWRLGPSCHLIGETEDELHRFAVRCGLHRRWFQAPPGASFPHYDLTESRRKIAVALGAVELDRKTFVEKMRELRSGLGLKEK